MMQIDWNRFVVLLLPLRLRTAVLFGYIRACLSPVATLHTELSDYDQQIRYKLAHTSQVWSIEKVLNDKFDPIERRIYTRNSGGEEVTLLHRRTDLIPVILQPRTEPPVLVHNRSAYEGAEFDAVVVTPYRYPAADIYAMRAWVNNYRLAGIRFDII